jgi:hypothetical protein
MNALAKMVSAYGLRGPSPKRAQLEHGSGLGVGTQLVDVDEVAA